jgi:hypothetical protein
MLQITLEACRTLCRELEAYRTRWRELTLSDLENKVSVCVFADIVQRFEDCVVGISHRFTSLRLLLEPTLELGQSRIELVL